MTAEAVTTIAASVGEALVNLCYCADNESREIVEAQLAESAQP